MQEAAEHHGATPPDPIQPISIAGLDRRSGVERRSEPSADADRPRHDRRQGERRSLKRIPAPMAGIGLISGQLIQGDRLLTFKLWDYSQAGACLILTTAAELSPGSELQVQLQDDTGPLGAPIAATLRWTALVGGNRFAGISFHHPLQAGPFFERYLRQSGYGHRHNG